MLSREHAIARVSERHELVVDRLTRAQRHYVDYVARMLQLYAEGIGRTRAELHAGVRQILAEAADCPPRRAEAFCRLLDEERIAAYDRDRGGKAAALRRDLFRAASPLHPLVQSRDRLFEHGEAEVKERLAQERNTTWPELEARLFADVIDFHRLREFHGYPTPEDLLSRYNVAQLQAALYDATRLVVRAATDFKIILRHAKLARLLHRVQREGSSGRYRIELDGPASILRETHRYGVAMARFLPALLACRDWDLRATIRRGRGGWKCLLHLSSQDGYRSHLPEPEDFDSTVEEKFFRKWGPEPRDGWRLEREGEVLCRQQHVFLPDFTLRHEDGRVVLLEIVGFWTPEYLQTKLETLRLFKEQRIVLAVVESAGEPIGGWPGEVLRYKTAVKLEPLLALLAAGVSRDASRTDMS